MTKLVMSAITQILSDQGAFATELGDLGIDTPVGDLLSQETIDLIVFDTAPNSSACGQSNFQNRPAGIGITLRDYNCPDFSKITLRNLMNTNHGMYDPFEEFLTDALIFNTENYVLYKLFNATGLDDDLIRPPQVYTNTADFFGKLYGGYKSNEKFRIGEELAPATQHIRGLDLEFSLGNAGYSILTVVLEEVTNKDADALINEYIRTPLSLGPMFLLTQDSINKRVVRGYQLSNANTLWPNVYKSIPFNDVLATDVHSELADGVVEYIVGYGDGGLVTSMKSYVAFLDAFVNGDLLSVEAKQILEDSFSTVDAFGVFGGGNGGTFRFGLGLWEFDRQINKSNENNYKSDGVLDDL